MKLPSAPLLALLFSATTSLAVAAEEPANYEDYLLGDMGGIRPALEDHGVNLSVEYTTQFWSTASGGIDEGSDFADDLNIAFEIDGEKAFGIAGNTVMLSFLNNNGTAANTRHVGSVQGVDNIETDTHTFKLFEAWVEQQFLDNRLSILLGLHDLNSEFWVTDISGNFIKPVMQIGQTLAQTGTNGPSVFPQAGLTGRVRVNPTENSYFMFAAYEGIPGDPDRTSGTHFSSETDEGLLLIAEAALMPPAPDGVEGNVNKFAIGAWRYTEEQPDLVGAGTSNQVGAYFLSSYQLYHNPTTGEGLAGFLNGGIAEGSTVQTDWDVEAGLVATGWVPNRPDGEIGLGIALAHNSDEYKTANTPSDTVETSYELYYRDTLWNGVTIQPDLQYVVNPGTDPSIDNATLVGMRLDFNL